MVRSQADTAYGTTSAVRDAKRIERLRRSQHGVRPEELRAVLESAGFTLVRTKGSHHIFSHPRQRRLLVVPYRRPLLPVYVRKALEAIDELAD
ncbi:MAG: type II toxin-antitoxin system HicA family toxin [Chloroflexi bacterium]|nr:type II toxin-antitoxin system HicA family toxin [Chloroflexota bacterium]